jgi:hypothetical protein
MKSLNNFENNVFSKEILEFIQLEGFEYKKNDSYCYETEENESYENYCYFKSAGHAYGDWPIHVYIFKKGIGVDVDYGCGGNSSNRFIKFYSGNDDNERIDYNEFERVYDEIVDIVNDYRNR